MQIRATPTLPARLVFYGARDYAGQLGRGDGYHRLTPTAVIVWMVESLLPDHDRPHSIFELRERHTHRLLSDHLAIHVLQLRSFRQAAQAGIDGRVERWARFFTARDEAALEQLAAEDPIMSLAKQTLEALSQDPETQRRAREREDAIKLYEMDLAAAREEAAADGLAKGLADGLAKGLADGLAKGLADGLAKGLADGLADGLAKGRAELLLRQLGLRFGSIADVARARVEAATSAQLDLWAERVLTAQTLDEVLAP